MELKRLNLSATDLEQIVATHFSRCEEERSKTRWLVVAAKLQQFHSCPNGFLAEHYELEVNIEFTEKGQTEPFSFFVKCLPVENPTLARYLKEIRGFHKETHVLTDIIPAIQQHIPWRTIAPVVYCTKELNLIVMNNLKTAGFAVITRESGLLECSFIRQALETLACLHAGSLVLEEKCGQHLTELFPNVLEENAWVNTPTSTRKIDVANVIKLYMELVKLCDKWQGSQEKTILAELPALFRTIYNYTVPSKRFRNCLNHGDLWCNNIMFNCNQRGNPTACILVDYQMSRYVPPAYDINLMLYLTASRQTRDGHRQAFLDFYYDCFSKTLDQNQLTSSIIFPRDLFLQSCEHYRLAGLIHSTMISGEVTLPIASLEEVFNNKKLSGGFMPEPKIWVCVKAFQIDTIYRNHLLELMDELFSYIPTAVKDSSR